MLKQLGIGLAVGGVAPAAFGRLCVETSIFFDGRFFFSPAAFGRLCVETDWLAVDFGGWRPAAFGRLCVETRW